MASMTDQLGEIFGTVKEASATAVATPTQEDLEKQAQVSFFTDLCAEKGIDVSKLNDDQVNSLFKTAMEMKAAGEAEESPDAKAKKAKDEADAKSKEASASKLAAASAEYQEKRAAAVKVAEADAMGRIMAHAYVDELRKIAGEMPPAFAAAIAGKKGDEGGDKPEKKDEKDEKEEKSKKEASAKAAALITEFEKTKTASAAPAGTPSLDEVAGNHAIDLLKQAGVDANEAVSRINAVHTLGVPDGAKVASAANLDAAVHVRALEYCEAAGYAVDWAQAS